MQAEAHIMNAAFEDSTWAEGGQRVRGFPDYYLASYASLDAATGLFHGYVKVCEAPPLSYWEADCVLKLAAEMPMPCAGTAMRAAEDVAHMQLANAGGLTGYIELRRVSVLGAPPDVQFAFV